MEQTTEPYIIALVFHNEHTPAAKVSSVISQSAVSADRCRVINDNTVVLSCPGVSSRLNRPQQPICHADDDRQPVTTICREVVMLLTCTD